MENIYLFGMILASNSFRFKEFVKTDEYSEIEESFRFPGGETGACATILSSLGMNVILDGNHIGRTVAPLIKEFYQNRTVNCDLLYFDEGYEGLEDYILISGDIRTPFGTFGHYFESAKNGGIRHWNKPDEKAISKCDVAAIDPFFMEESELATEYCVKHGKPYVTIDCLHDSAIHKNAAVSVISGEFIRSAYANKSHEDLLSLFCENSNGLTIITNGGKEFLYGRNGSEIKSFRPFQVDVKSTLGAGDSFKAGCTYALAMGMGDDNLVEFASACAATAISRYPMQLYPPTLREIKEMIKSRK